MKGDTTIKKNLEKILNGEINIVINFDLLSLEDKVNFSCEHFEKHTEDIGYCHKNKSVEAYQDCKYKVTSRGRIATKCKSFEPIEFYMRVLLPYKQYIKKNG